MTKTLKIVTLFALAAILGVASLQAKSAKVGFPDIEHAALKEAIAEGKVFLIDVNGSLSYREGHIPGAVDFAALGKDLVSVLPEQKDAMIVAYCGGPLCGAYKQAAKVAVGLGYTDVRHYSAGISGWKRAGEDVAKVES